MMVCPDVVRVLHCVRGAGCLVYLHANVTLSGVASMLEMRRFVI